MSIVKLADPSPSVPLKMPNSFMKSLNHYFLIGCLAFITLTCTQHWLANPSLLRPDAFRVVKAKQLRTVADRVAPGETESKVDFSESIKPLLSDRCYKCHGPDAENRQADLRLDLGIGLDKMTAQSSDRKILVPGNPDASELYQRIISHDSDLMPPEDSSLELSESEIQQIRQWIIEGAKWEKHWSFQALPDRVPVPAADGSNWQHNAIDHFVLRRLKQAELTPALPTAPSPLIRRLYFDLIGLPPNKAEVKELLALPAHQVIEATIDRLLQRPEFGERMAADWLDAARYSDTFGYQVDRDRFVWPWRDWVIGAFNDNLPYDQFLTLQVAGDLLPNATFEQILPTTFNRLHPQKVEGGSVEEEFRIEYVADRSQTVATAFLGLTMECCRCHDHKYDPLTQANYFQLSAFFDNIDEAGLYSYFTNSVPTPTAVMPDVAAESRVAELRSAQGQAQAIAAESRNRIQKQRPWSDAAPTPLRPGDPLGLPGQIAYLDFEKEAAIAANSENKIVPRALINPNSATANRQADASKLNAPILNDSRAVELSGDEGIDVPVGNFGRWQPFSVSLWMKSPDLKDRAVVFHRSRAWTDAASRGYELLIIDGKLQASLIHFWPGNAISIQTSQTLPVDQWVHVTFSYDGSSQAKGIELIVNGALAPSSIVRDHLTKEIKGGGGDTITIGERFRDRGFQGGQVDEFRVFGRQLSRREQRVLAQPDLSLGKAALGFNDPTANLDSDAQASQALESELAEHWALAFSPAHREYLENLAQHRRQIFDIQNSRTEIMVMKELTSPKPTFLLNRGAYDAPGPEVFPNTPEAVLPFADHLPKNRLGLARWMLDRKNPLTARVAVNRLWQLLFGDGLVRTPEDFGNQGSVPTHPQLLDYLAVDFIQSGWDVKRMIKQMAMSATYQQSSFTNKQTKELDPENMLWSRSNSKRLSAETIRDQALAASGLLVQKMGGPPTRPYDLAEAFSPSNPDGGDAQYRRSLYTYWKRTAPSPAMIALDSAKRDVCQVKRERTVSPAQSLVLLNAPQFVEASRALASSVLSETDNDQQAIAEIFWRLTSRDPTENEALILKKLQVEQLARFIASPEATDQYLQVGNFRIPDQLDAARVASFALLANTLMGLDECTSRR